MPGTQHIYGSRRRYRVTTQGRRLFKRAEVAWVAEQLRTDARQALAMMDWAYRDALQLHGPEETDARTWRVDRHQARTRRHVDTVELRLATLGEDQDARFPAEPPLPAGRAIRKFYRGERG